MAGLNLSGRAAGLCLVLLVLAGCASTPAPVTSRWPGSHRPPAPWDNTDAGLAAYGLPRVLADTAPLQCVPFARSASGIEIYGDAVTWWEQAAGRYPRSNLPAPGSVLVLEGYNDASRGHVAVVTNIVSQRVIRVDQANWLNGGEISLNVPVLDVSPNNDWSEVRVWHIPGGHWGGRIYRAEGFIHNFLLASSS